MLNPGMLGQGPALFAVSAGMGYFLGALPFGAWVARAHGVDIFAVGSRSSGATNVRRVLGWKAANWVLALDVLKGAAAVAVPLLLRRQAAGAAAYAGYVGLAGALIGHSFSCFVGFRGGKGVATAAGGLAVLLPVVASVAVTLWAVILWVARFVSLASVLAALSLPVSAYLFGRSHFDIAVTAAIALFVVVRHRANLARLIAGTEPRFGAKP